MTYLFTLFPFDSSEPNGSVSEATIAFNAVFNEIRITLKTGSVVHVPVDRLRFMTWLRLLAFDSLKLTCMVSTSLAFSDPYAVKVHAVSKHFEVPLWNPLVMAVEKELASVMRYSFAIDTPKKRGPWDSFPKVADIATSVTVAPCVHWSYESSCFVEAPTEGLKALLKPVAVVSTVTDHWRGNLLVQWSTARSSLKKRRVDPPDASRLDAPDTALVITEDVAAWTQAAKGLDITCGVLGTISLSRDTLSQTRLVIATPMCIAQEIMTAEDLEQSIRVGARCTSIQARRLAVHVVTQNFSNFTLPLDYVKFNMLMIDTEEDLGMLSPGQSSRCVRIHKDARTKPRGSYLCANVPKWAFSLALTASEVLYVPVPKTVLKHYHIVGHPIKATVAEERIAKTFQNRFCPLEASEAILRFAQKSMPIGVVKELMRSHFQRLQISLASFASTEAPVAVNAQYALKAIDESKTCCVCFDPTNADKWAITLCGHVFCKDCARQHFYKEWTDGKAKDCAQCRTPLLSGDFFLIESFDKQSYVPAISAKKQAVRSFTTGVRSSLGIQFWGQPDCCERPKHLVIEDVATVTAPEIITKYQGLQVHVFYGPEESRAFHNLLESF